MENLVQISIRSYLTMGTAAVVGAGAIALTPVLPASGHTAHIPAPVTASVSLAGDSFSLTDIVGLLGDGGLGGGSFSLGNIADLLGNVGLGGGSFSLGDIADLLGNAGLGDGSFSLPSILDLFNGGGGFSLPSILDLFNGGGSFSLPDIFNLFNGGLADLLPGVPADLVNTVLTEVIKEVRPLLTTAAGDIFQYAGSTFKGLFIGPDSIPAQIVATVVGVPAVFKAALAAVKAGDFGLAIKTLGAGLVAPLTAVRQALNAAVDGLKTFVSGQVQDLVGKVPAIVISAVEKAIGGLGAGAATPAGSLAAVTADGPTSSDVVEPAAEVSVSAAAASRTPRAAESVRADAPVAAEPAEPAVVAEAPAPQAVSDEAAAPVTRPRAGAVRAAIADAVANGPAVTNRPKPTLRADRANAERPKAAAAARS